MARVAVRTADSDVLELSADDYSSELVPGSDPASEQLISALTHVVEPPTTAVEIPRTATGLPKPPGVRVIAEQFFNYIATFTPEDWAHSIAYVYRLYPAITRPRGQSNIRKFSEPYTLANLLQEFGEGDYQIKLNDTAIRGKFQTICETKVEHRDPENKPKLNLEELAVSDPKNRSYVEWCVREGLLSSQGEIMQQAQAAQQAQTENTQQTKTLADALVRLVEQTRQTSPGGASQMETKTNDAVMAGVVKMMADAGQKATEMAFAQVKQNDPEHFIKVFTMFRDLAQPAAATSGGNDLMLKMLIEQNARLAGEAQEERKASRDMMLAMMKEKKDAAGTGSIITQLKDLLEVRDLLGGGNNNGPVDWKEMAIQQGIPALQGILSMFAGRLQSAPAPAQTQTQPMQQSGPQQNLPTQPQPQPQPQQNGAQTPTMQPNSNPSTQAVNATALAELRTVFENYGQYLLNAFNAGSTGDAFAESVATILSTPTYLRIANFGVENIHATIMQIPALAAAFNGLEPQLLTFVQEFVAYGAGDGDTDGAPEPVADIEDPNFADGGDADEPVTIDAGKRKGSGGGKKAKVQ